MVLLLSLTFAVVAILFALLRPNWRRTLAWGAGTILPLVGWQLLVAGSVSALGLTRLDGWLVLLELLLAGAGASAILAVVGERLVGRWLASTSHDLRARLWWWLAGFAVALMAGAIGVPWSVALIGGLLINFTLTWRTSRTLIWEVLISVFAFSAWYIVAYLWLRQPVSGQFEDAFLGTASAGLTIFGAPLNELFVVGLLGVMIGPLFAATKYHRQPDYPRHDHPALRTIGTGLSLAGITLAIGVVIGWQVLWPPMVYALKPTTGNVATTQPTLTIKFTRPVDRNMLETTISPNVEGSWKFSDGETWQHGFRQATFHFDTTLAPDTTYTVNLTNVRSLFGLVGRDVEWRFTTAAAPDVAAFFPAVGTDPCAPMTVTLAATATATDDFSFRLDPAVPLQVTASADVKSFTLQPQPCLAPATVYQFFVDRRTMVRDANTGELIAQSDASPIFTTTFTSVGQPPAPPAPEPAPTPTSEPVTVTPAPVAEAVATVRTQKILSIKLDYQDRPLSCEAAALKMALAGRGVKVTETQIMNIVGYDKTPHRGDVWGDPDMAFVGSIDGHQNTTGYGVHWGPIARTARTWRPGSKAFVGGTVTTLTAAIDADSPVVIWGTIGSAYYNPWKTTSGKTVKAWKGEHARTLIGYIGPADNPTSFVINDPVVGRVTWSRATLEANWKRFDNSGVIVD